MFPRTVTGLVPPTAGAKTVGLDESRCHALTTSAAQTNKGVEGKPGSLWTRCCIIFTLNNPCGFGRNSTASSPVLLVKWSQDETLDLTWTNRLVLGPERLVLTAPRVKCPSWAFWPHSSRSSEAAAAAVVLGRGRVPCCGAPSSSLHPVLSGGEAR